MKRIAFFVEGQTEQVFIEKLLTEIAGQKNIQFELRKFQGYKNPTKVIRPSLAAPDSPKYGALIYDCATDGQVKSKILENNRPEFWSRYDRAIGIRDLYPKALTELHRLQQGLAAGLPDTATMLVAVREIEAWFIAECSHYTRIDPSLDSSRALHVLGLDPCLEDVAQIEHPAKSLGQVYRSGTNNYNYSKRKKTVSRTVNHLDYAQVYFNLPERIPALAQLIREIDDFLG